MELVVFIRHHKTGLLTRRTSIVRTNPHAALAPHLVGLLRARAMQAALAREQEHCRRLDYYIERAYFLLQSKMNY